MGQRQRLHRRVTEPNKLDECSLTLHHLSDDCFVKSLRDDINDDVDGGVIGRGEYDGNKGVRNGNESEDGGELELDELEFKDVDDELVGELDEESIAARECGWIDVDDDDGSDGGGGNGSDGIVERKSIVFKGNLACNNCNALCRIIASVCKRSNGDQDDIGDGNIDCFSVFVVAIERGFKGIGRAIVGWVIVLFVRSLKIKTKQREIRKWSMEIYL